MTQWGLDTLFNPAKRHMDDEKQRLQSTREEVGDNSGGRRVDLESGKVVIRKHDSDEQDATSEPDDALVTETASTAAKAVSSKAVSSKAASAETPAAKPEPSAAAKRAAARRGRTAR